MEPKAHAGGMKLQPLSVLGHVAVVWLHPVKSMQGEELGAAFVDEAGVLGDRAYALCDVETWHSVSAKHPRRWAAVFACRAVYQRTPRPGEPLPNVEIMLPDGTTVSSADPAVHQGLSDALGHARRPPCCLPSRRLRRAPLPPERACGVCC